MWKCCGKSIYGWVRLLVWPFRVCRTPRPRVRRTMSARVYPHLRESRVGILPKREADGKRKLSESHARAPQITHRFSTARKMAPELFYREISVAISKRLLTHKNFLRAFAHQRADAFEGAFAGRAKSKIPHDSVPRSNRSGSMRMAFAVKGAPAGDRVR
jgi:hypothetical protein